MRRLLEFPGKMERVDVGEVRIQEDQVGLGRFHPGKDVGPSGRPTYRIPVFFEDFLEPVGTADIAVDDKNRSSFGQRLPLCGVLQVWMDRAVWRSKDRAYPSSTPFRYPGVVRRKVFSSSRIKVTTLPPSSTTNRAV